MSKTILMVPTATGSLFLYGIIEVKGKEEMVYRTSNNIEYLQNQEITRHQGQLLFGFHSLPEAWVLLIPEDGT